MDKTFYRECPTGRRFIVRLDPGAKLVASLLELAKVEKMPLVSLVSAVGSIRNVEFTGIQAGAHLPITGPRIKTHSLEGPLELIGLEGNLAPRANQELSATLCILAAKSSGEVVGGRLVEAEVFAGCELVLTEFLAEGIERQPSAATGVEHLVIKER